jgi:hypothetical protein
VRHDAFVSKLGLGKQQTRAALVPLSAEIAPKSKSVLNQMTKNAAELEHSQPLVNFLGADYSQETTLQSRDETADRDDAYVWHRAGGPGERTK